MAVNVAQDAQFTFIAGLNSEASYFTFPKNTWKDGLNLVPNVSGVLSKRPCIDLENGYTLSSISIAEANRNSWAYACEKWSAVAGNGDLNFIVVQAGRYVFFYDDVSISTSATKKAFSIDLASYVPTSNTMPVGTAPIKAIPANGKLIITSQNTLPLLVSYIEDAGSFTVSTVSIQIRDFQGVDDGLAINTRPGTLSALHQYNLYNQGWLADKVTAYYSSRSVYPSNVQSWVYGKNSTDDFDATVLDKQDFGTSPAPKGRYVLDAFYEDRSSASGVAGISIISEKYRPSTCAFFAGRAWYSGIKSSRLGANVYFSQVALTSDKYGKCYQDADPTSEVISDLLDNDGGVISIQDCGQIIDIISMAEGIVVLASNGIWQIIGTSNSGFTAAGYEVKKISSYGAVSRSSIVQVENELFYWSQNSICKVAIGETGLLVVSSVTDLNIKSLYNTISSLAKFYASGSYNASIGIVKWAFDKDLIDDSSAFPYKKTRLLCLDVRLSAFYMESISSSTTTPYVVDVISTRESNETVATFTVVSGNGSTVVDGSSNTVSVTTEVKSASFKQFKYLSVVPNGSYYEVSFADQLSDRAAPDKWRDWFTYNSVGIPYDCYLITGYSFAPNGPDKKKQSMYVTTFMERTETGFDYNYVPINESSCMLSGRWDFSDSDYSGKWSAPQQIYKHRRMFIPSTQAFDDGYPVIITKSKVRGRGHALQLKFEGSYDYDMRIFGWSATMYGGTNV